MKTIDLSNIKLKLRSQLIDNEKEISRFDAIIITLIIISSLSILLEISLVSTRFSTVFYIIELLTTIIFTIEYLFRFWVSFNGKTKMLSLKKSLQYVFSFYGLIDLISILPFYFGLLIGTNTFGFLKIIRIIRLLRLARYLKSFDFIINATKNKKSELFISMQIVLLFTFVLSVLLFFVEHKVQPENFSTVADALIWSFSKYIGDIAGYGDFTPLSVAGKILATAVGILSIAIFAVPAGIIASGFVEEIEASKKLKEVTNTQLLIERSFEPNNNSILGIKTQPRKRSIQQIQARLTLAENEIFEAVRNSDNLRIIWDKSDPKSQNFDLIVVENILKNTKYGYCETQLNSPIRIINPLGKGERAISHFCQTLSQLGAYQIVSNEVFSGGDFEPETKFRLDVNEAYAQPNLFEKLPSKVRLFCKDATKDLNIDNWVIIFRSSASHRDLDFHVTFGGEKGELTSSEVKHPTINDISKLDEFLLELKHQMLALDLKVGTHEDFTSISPNLLHQYIFKECQANVLTIFISINLLSSPDRVYYKVMENIHLSLKKLVV